MYLTLCIYRYLVGFVSLLFDLSVREIPDKFSYLAIAVSSFVAGCPVKKTSFATKL